LSTDAAQGAAPCASCGTVNAPFVNPYAAQPQPQTFGQAANPGIAPSPERSPVVFIVVAVAIFVALAIGGAVTAFFLGR